MVRDFPSWRIARGDSKIAVLNDDTIDIQLAGANDFQFEANILHALTGSVFQQDDLTAGRVLLVGAAGILADDADITFSVDTLTVTKIAATTFTGDVSMSGVDLTSVRDLTFTSQIIGGTDAVAIDTQNSNGKYLMFRARDTGVGMVEVARQASAANPYFSMGASQEFKFYTDGTYTLAGLGTISRKLTLTQTGDYNIDATRTSVSATNSVIPLFKLVAATTQDMVDGFGGSIDFWIDDAGTSPSAVARIAGIRDGDDSSGALVFYTDAADQLALTLGANKLATFGAGAYFAGSIDFVNLAGIRAGIGDGNIVYFQAKDTGVGWVTIGTLTGASDPYFGLGGGNEFKFFNSGISTIAGSIYSLDAAGWALAYEAATATNPTLIPNRADYDTGIGWATTDILSLIAGGEEVVRVTRNANAPDWVSINGSTVLNGGTDDKVLYVNAILNATEAPGGSDEFRLIKGNATVTDITGWNDTWLIDLQVSTVSKFNVDFTGFTTIGGGMAFTAGGIAFNTSGVSISARNADTATLLFKARDTGVALVEVGRLVGAADPYFALGGSSEFKFYNSGYTTFGANAYALDAAGWGLLNIAATSTAPTVVPNRADQDTGIGWEGNDVLALIVAAHRVVRLYSQTTNGDWVYILGGTLTTGGADGRALHIVSTLNDSGAPGANKFSLITGDITETDITGWATVGLIDLRVDTVSKFYVSRIGKLTLGDGASLAANLSMNGNNVTTVAQVKGTTGAALIISSLYEAVADSLILKTAGVAAGYAETERMTFASGAAIARIQIEAGGALNVNGGTHATPIQGDVRINGNDAEFYLNGGWVVAAAG